MTVLVLILFELPRLLKLSPAAQTQQNNPTHVSLMLGWPTFASITNVLNCFTAMAVNASLKRKHVCNTFADDHYHNHLTLFDTIL